VVVPSPRNYLARVETNFAIPLPSPAPRSLIDLPTCAGRTPHPRSVDHEVDHAGRHPSVAASVPQATPMGEAIGPFEFDAEVWEWDGPASWHFVSLPVELAELVREIRPRTAPGFGAVRVEATIGSCTWRTSLFPDKERATYLLPLKVAVRRAAGLEDGSRSRVELLVL
jgi:hypothetical protein